MSEPRLRFGTDLITFYEPTMWGLPADVPNGEWIDLVTRDPRPYFDRMLDLVVESGLEGVELAPNPAGWSNALAAYGGTVGGVSQALRSRGLDLASSFAHGRQLIGNTMADPDYESEAVRELDAHAAFVAELGAKTITIGNLSRIGFGAAHVDESGSEAAYAAPVDLEVHERFADVVNRFGKVVGRHGVQLAIHTDAYSICSRPEDIRTVLSLTDPATVGICLDAGHVTLDGGDAVAVLAEHLPRTPIMHWKDCAGAHAGHLLRGDQATRHVEMLKHFRVLGSGIVDWQGWMKVLRENSWEGWAIEEIDYAPNPVAELRQGLEYYREHLRRA